VAIPRGTTAFDCVRALEDWLEERGLWGSGIDGLIACFYNPDTFPKKHREDLDRAGVEQVQMESTGLFRRSCRE